MLSEKDSHIPVAISNNTVNDSYRDERAVARTLGWWRCSLMNLFI